MKSNTHRFTLNQAVTVFDQKGRITEVMDETRSPFLYQVTFDETQKSYVIEAGHIEHWKDPRPVTERIKTFEDACRELGENHAFVETYNVFEHDMRASVGAEFLKDIAAYLKLRIIAAALNEGWEPEYSKDEVRWYPWHYLYTKEEIDEMSDEDKEKISLVLWGGLANGGSSCGLGFARSRYAFSHANAIYGSRLALKSEELASYFGKQFINIWCEFLIGK